MIINELIKSMEDINIKEIPGNGNPEKTNIAEKILDFNEQEKIKVIKIFFPKQNITSSSYTNISR